MSRAPSTTLDEVGQALVRAAGELLAAEGAAALTVRAIAARAGTSTMNVYSRFGGKDGVVEHLYLEGFQLLAEAMRQADEPDAIDGPGDRPPHAGTGTGTGDPMVDLQRCGHAYRQFALSHATLYAVMFDRVVADYEPSAAAMAAGLATLDQLAERLSRAMDRGQLRRIDPAHAAAIVWSTCHGVMSLELKHDGRIPIDWQQVFDDATAAVLRGLAT